jgi:hypothetical protein
VSLFPDEPGLQGTIARFDWAADRVGYRAERGFRTCLWGLVPAPSGWALAADQCGTQIAVPEATSTKRCPSPYQLSTFRNCQTVRRRISICWSEGRRDPTRRGRPMAPFLRSGAGPNKRASRRRRVMHVIGRRRTAQSDSSCREAKAPSATTTSRRVGNQRCTCSNSWRAQCLDTPLSSQYVLALAKMQLAAVPRTINLRSRSISFCRVPGLIQARACLLLLPLRYQHV